MARSLLMNIYDMALKFYFGVIRLISSRHHKAKLMTEGRIGLVDKLKAQRSPQDRYIWIHASSLGEFEQGRPLIEKIKEQYTEYKVCLTFFSPSGYEVRKDYPLADIVTYLPYDTSSDLQAFIDILAPERAIFIKYEVWLHTLSYLKEKGVPTYLVSAIFRPQQIFFKPYGQIFREALDCYTWIFVQNEASYILLQSIGLKHLSIAGDTRTDRVWDIKSSAQDDSIVEAFVRGAHEEGQKILMVGSSWEEDETTYLPLLEQDPRWRIVIVPHEISTKRIQTLRARLKHNSVLCHTEVHSLDELTDVRVLIVDKMGLLSSLYKYTDVAYIGGGFGRGIHNTLEAAVYDVPILFGPKYHKFMEAEALVATEAAFCVHTDQEVVQVLDRLFEDSYRMTVGARAGAYIQSNLGSTDAIMSGIFTSSKSSEA